MISNLILIDVQFYNKKSLVYEIEDLKMKKNEWFSIICKRKLQ